MGWGGAIWQIRPVHFVSKKKKINPDHIFVKSVLQKKKNQLVRNIFCKRKREMEEAYIARLNLFIHAPTRILAQERQTTTALLCVHHQKRFSVLLLFFFFLFSFSLFCVLDGLLEKEKTWMHDNSGKSL